MGYSIGLHLRNKPDASSTCITIKVSCRGISQYRSHPSFPCLRYVPLLGYRAFPGILLFFGVIITRINVIDSTSNSIFCSFSRSFRFFYFSSVHSSRVMMILSTAPNNKRVGGGSTVADGILFKYKLAKGLTIASMILIIIMAIHTLVSPSKS